MWCTKLPKMRTWDLNHRKLNYLSGNSLKQCIGRVWESGGKKSLQSKAGEKTLSTNVSAGIIAPCLCSTTVLTSDGASDKLHGQRLGEMSGYKKSTNRMQKISWCLQVSYLLLNLVQRFVMCWSVQMECLRNGHDQVKMMHVMYTNTIHVHYVHARMSFRRCLVQWFVILWSGK